MLGAGTTAGAFLAFGMTPLATSPAAHADVFDVIIDPIINSILGSVTSLDALAGIDPSSALDLGSLTLPATDAALASEPLAAAASSADALTAAAPAADPTLADMFQTDFWAPLHAADQAWINSPTGEAFDNAINPYFATGDLLWPICNGTDGSITDPTGGNGGLWFGDGGTGYDRPLTPAWPAAPAGMPGGGVTAATAATAGWRRRRGRRQRRRCLATAASAERRRRHRHLGRG